MDSDDAGDGATQRRSGRVVRPPAKYLPDAAPPPPTTTTTKRKRIGEDGHDMDSDESSLSDEVLLSDDDDNDDDEHDDNSDDGVESDDANDGDHIDGEARRAAARSKKRRANGNGHGNGNGHASTATKRAAKKPKLNGSAASAAAASLPSRPKKSVRVTIETDGDRDHGSELYTDIFSSGDDSDDVAARWFERYQANNQAAVADLVNCILSAAGCDYHITEDDINDPDNCSNRLTELQAIYEDQKITDYPLIAKSRATRSFRELLVSFFHALINVLHETEVLYTQPEIMENVLRWVASLSSSTLRPFRHTATTVALAMLAMLVDVAKKLDDRISKMTQQVESQRGRNGNKNNKNGTKDTRLLAFEATLRETNHHRERVAELMKESFDVVFVHRYRDVDPRIRTECVEALGSWVWALPAVYMQPEYLRYLGWMLSDVHAATRQEVLKQLGRVFKRDASKMGHFIDRFRARLIEMATKDADLGVRVSAIGVVEQLRPAGLLEPDEIDAIGQLIFDAELRIRRATVGFFADCVREFAAIKLDEIGGDEVLQELFGRGASKASNNNTTTTNGGSSNDHFDAPRRDWVDVKSLASTIAAYEVQLGEERSEPTLATLDVAAEAAHAAVAETSRLALATQVLVDKIPEITNWEIIAGYLLYDHSVDANKAGRSGGGGGSRKQARTADMTFRMAVAPAANEEAILLEILAAAAKASLTPGGESERFRRRLLGQSDAMASAAEASEQAALLLAGLIPQLLRKFGAEPATAVTVLRLQHSLNLEVFRQLRQDTATFESLLDEICTQFTRHADTGVVAEAAAALLHARQYDELEEVVDGRVSALWDTTINALRSFDRTCELSARRNLSVARATDLSVTLFKLGKLASIADCVDVLEAEGPGADAESSTSPVIDLLIKTVHRGKFEEPDEDLDNIEDGLTANAIGACQFYFMWKLRSLVLAVQSQTTVTPETVDSLALRQRAFDQNVVHTFSSRGYNDDLRLYATGAYCDLHVLFAQLRRSLQAAANNNSSKYANAGLGRLVDPVPAGLINELLSIFHAAERTFAKKTKKTLNDPADDEDPIADPLDDDDDDDEDDDDEDNDEDTSVEERRAAELKAERALCDLTSHYVMAIAARVLDQTGPQAGRLRRRLLRNQTKLGPSYKEIVAFLDESKAAELLAASSRKRGGGGGTQNGGVGGVGGGSSNSRNRGKERATSALPSHVYGGGHGSNSNNNGGRSAATPAPTTPGAHLGLSHDEVLLGAPTPAAELDDDELDDLLDTPEPEEGTLEDLRRRELVEAELDDDDDGDGDGGDGDDDDEGKMDDDESILGD